MLQMRPLFVRSRNIKKHRPIPLRRLNIHFLKHLPVQTSNTSFQTRGTRSATAPQIAIPASVASTPWDNLQITHPDQHLREHTNKVAGDKVIVERTSSGILDQSKAPCEVSLPEGVRASPHRRLPPSCRRLIPQHMSLPHTSFRLVLCHLILLEYLLYVSAAENGRAV